MKRRIAVLTADDYLYQKIYLTLKSSVEVFRTDSAKIKDADLILTDEEEKILDKRCVLIGRGADAALRVPFKSEALIRLVAGDVTENVMRLDGRAVYFKGEKIKLTEVEYSLLSSLISAGGNFIEREALLKSVWGEGADGGVLNVYVHYLREKLEACGEKVIISSRKQGYKIDEKYLKSEEETQC